MSPTSSLSGYPSGMSGYPSGLSGYPSVSRSTEARTRALDTLHTYACGVRRTLTHTAETSLARRTFLRGARKADAAGIPAARALSGYPSGLSGYPGGLSGYPSG
eukprot:936208-Pyramimonas_sp.AAC.3